MSINDGVGAITVSGAINVTNNNLAGGKRQQAEHQRPDRRQRRSGRAAGAGRLHQANANAGITADNLRGRSHRQRAAGADRLTAADVNTVSTFAGLATTGRYPSATAAFNVGLVNATQITAVSVSLEVNTAGKTITQTAGADGTIVTPILNRDQRRQRHDQQHAATSPRSAPSAAAAVR